MKFLVILVFLVSFISCGTNVEYKRIIQNDSDFDIWLFNPNVGSMTDCSGLAFDSVAIPRKTSYTLEGGTAEQPISFFSDCPFFCIDTLESRIHNRDSLDLNTSLSPTNPRWTYNIFQPGDRGSCECRLVITNDDIE